MFKGRLNYSALLLLCGSVINTYSVIAAPPTITNPGSQDRVEGTHTVIPIYANDPEGLSLIYAATGLPVGMMIESDSGLLHGTPTFDSSSPHPYKVTVTVTDAEDLSASASFDMKVSDAIDPSASTVHLRKDCTGYENCFTTTITLKTWIETTRAASGTMPELTVEVGPGRFSTFQCQGQDNITLRGSGQSNTIFGSTYSFAGINGANCNNFVVQDLTAEGSLAAVGWSGLGSSEWHNVHQKGGTYGWTESGCGGVVTNSDRPVHRFYSSKITASFKVAYLAQCSENWFFGSEIVASGSVAGGSLRGITARTYTGNNYNPEIHVYGGVIRVIATDPDATFVPPDGGGDGSGFIAVGAGYNAEIHIHGTGIDVLGNGKPNEIAALAVNGGKIHAAQSSFVLQTGTGGTAHRIHNLGGEVHAPYLWETAAINMNLSSDEGADMVVESTCVDASCTDQKPHLLIYSNSCTTDGHWYDTVAQKCRGE